MRVLLVEDNPGDADLIIEMLDRDAAKGFEIVHVPRLASAAEVVGQGEIDLVLLDLGLPDSSGLDTVRNLRKCAKEIPIVVLTGNQDSAVGAAAIDEGAQDYAVKGRLNGESLARMLRYAAQRHRATIQVHRSEEFLRATIDALHSNIAILDENGVILEVNEAWKDFTRQNGGLIELTWQGVNYLNACRDGALGDKVAQGIRAVLNGEQSFYDVEYPCDSPTEIRWFRCTVTRFRWDGPPRVVVAHEDITARVLNEQALRQTQGRLERAIRAGKVGLWEWDPVTGVAEYSKEWCEHLGCQPEALIGTIQDTVNRLHSDDLVTSEGVWAHPSQHLVPSYTLECRMRHEDGEYRSIICRMTMESDGDGNPLRVYGANVEITELRTLQYEFIQAQKMESIGRLAGGVAHDFNNLLSVIGGYSELALTSLEPGTPLRDDIHEIKLAADRASDLTRQLLAFSRRQVMRPEVICVNAVIGQSEKMLRRLIGEDINFEVHLDPGLSQVLADPGQIEQVLMNLAVNARDAMPSGGRLVVETHNEFVDEDFTRRHSDLDPGAFVRIIVSDTGSGMDERTLDRIFDPFFTTKEQGKGTGLGLAMVYGIIKQSGGLVWPYSELGKGTTFNIYLPMIEGQVAAILNAEQPETLKMGTETILVAEDEPALRLLAHRSLSEAGYTVHTASNGMEALAIVLQGDEIIDLLLTDVIMPKMGGRELAEQLTARFPGLPVIFMSGYTDEAISHHGVLDHGVHLMNKPFTRAQLTQKIREVLDTVHNGTG